MWNISKVQENKLRQFTEITFWCFFLVLHL